MISGWFADNYIELFGALTGIIYVFLEIRQIVWLWPLGIVTSALYIAVFFSSKFYADMSLQVYYLAISVLGWYWWAKGAGRKKEGTGQRAQAKGTDRLRSVSSGVRRSEEGEQRTSGGWEDGGMGEEEKRRAGEEEEINDNGKLLVTRIKRRTGVILLGVFAALYLLLWFVLSRFTDSPVPRWDSFLTSLSIIATWMLARKIFEHWYLWIIVNSVSSFVFYIKGLYPTVILYIVYCIMSFAGLIEWRKSL